MLKKLLTGILSLTMIMNQGILLYAEEDDSDITTYEETGEDSGSDSEQTEWGEDAVATKPVEDESESVDEAYVGDDEDPMEHRDTEIFYQDENGEYSYSEENEIMTMSTDSMKVNSLTHQSKFSNATKRIGIDVSEYQKDIDWNAVKNDGVEFAFIRVGYRGYVYARLVEDKKLQQNLQNAKAAGIKVGVYFYSKAINTTEAVEEANFVVNAINATSLDLPIFLDVEYDGSADRLLNANLSSSAQTDIVNAFISTCNTHGYSAGVYASANVLKTKMDASSIADRGYVWLAHWTSNTNYSGTFNFWQYGGTESSLTVNGISDKVDGDVWYDDGTTFNNVSNSVSMYRIYNPNSGEHFYTASIAERNNLTSLGWRYEGVGWTAPAYSSTPVYRLYNKNGGEHHYTVSAEERDNLVRLGWRYEGIGWYSDDSHRVAVYREYNPNAFANNHNYTASSGEHNWLIGLGWRNEGIGWYGI
jgi:lysozyme